MTSPRIRLGRVKVSYGIIVMFWLGLGKVAVMTVGPLPGQSSGRHCIHLVCYYLNGFMHNFSITQEQRSGNRHTWSFGKLWLDTFSVMTVAVME